MKVWIRTLYLFHLGYRGSRAIPIKDLSIYYGESTKHGFDYHTWEKLHSKGIGSIQEYINGFMDTDIIY